MYPFPSFDPACRSETVASCPEYRFLRKQVRWSVIPLSLRSFYSLLWSTLSEANAVHEAEVDVFLEFPCYLYDPMDVGNLISGSSAFSKSSLNIWRFLVHILLKLDLENSEYCFVSMWDECNCVVLWTFFGIALWDWLKTDLFQSWGHCWVFQICWHIECSTSKHHLLGFEIAQL